MDHENQVVIRMTNSATPIGKLMFYPIIKKADIRIVMIERRLWVDLTADI